MIQDFDNNKLDYDNMEDFVLHVINCKDCQEEYEIYNIAKYALPEDDSFIDDEILNEPDNVQKLIKAYDFKGLVDLRLKNAMALLDSIKKTEYYHWCLLSLADICVLLMAVFFLFGNVLM